MSVLTGPFGFRIPQWTYYLLAGSDSLLQLPVCTLSTYRINHTYTQQLKPPPTAPHTVTTNKLTLDLEKPRKQMNISFHTQNIREFNSAYRYSTIPHKAITPLSRQLLMMGMEFPETC